MAPAQPAPVQTEPASDARRSSQSLVDLTFRLYKSLLSPVMHTIAPSRCLYLPTCSEYAYTAISRFGIVRGAWLAVRRFARCHPWGNAGLDPVPGLSSTDRPAAHPAASGSIQNGVDHLP